MKNNEFIKTHNEFIFANEFDKSIWETFKINHPNTKQNHTTSAHKHNTTCNYIRNV